MKNIDWSSFRHWLAAVTGILLLSSCKDNRFKPVYPVTGKIFYEGKPAAGATVALQPLSDEIDPLVRPMGEVDEEGKFTVSTYKTGDGAPAGKYAVRVIWLPKGYDGPVERGNKLPARYADVSTSGLGVEVKPESNVVPDFELKK